MKKLKIGNKRKKTLLGENNWVPKITQEVWVEPNFISSLVDVFLRLWILLSIFASNCGDLGNDFLEYENLKF